MKKCLRCKLEKSSEEFYVRSKNKDGLMGICKRCEITRTQKHRLLKREYYLAYDKARNKVPERREQIKVYNKKYREENPEKEKAHKAVLNAIRNGSLKKESCYCGNPMVEGHHPDYSKPLFVIWLCHKHHKHIHGRTAY